MNRMALSGFVVAVAVGMAGFPAQQAFAQSTQQDSLEEIVVTGYAISLKKAIDNKRNNEVISDGIAAEDIGKFPETNLAESLQHITGVQITRSQGEGQFISVRGLDPKFTDILYNGREIPAGTGTRAFDFRTLASNFASQVDVYKSPTADMLESGLAATVNVQSVRPLDYGKERFGANLDGIYDNQAKGVKPHLSALYTDTFFDNRFGLAVGVDYSERNVNDEQSTTTGNLTQSYPYHGAPTPMDVIYGIGLNYNEGNNKRKSAMAALQFKPNDVLELRLDTLVSSFEQRYNEYQGDSFWPGANAGASPVSSVTLDANNSATAWSGSNVFGYIASNYNDITQNLNSTALGATLSLGDWKVDGEASYGYSKEETTTVYLNTGTLPGAGASIFYNTNGNPNQSLAFGFTNGFDATNPSNFAYQTFSGSYKAPTSDEIKNVRVDATRRLNWGWLSDVEFGLNYDDRVLTNNPNEMSVPTSYVAAAIGTGSNGLPNIAPYYMLYNNSAFPSFPRTFLTVNLNSFFGKIPLGQAAAAFPAVPQLSSTTDVEEKSEAAYAKIRFAGADDRLKGNAGVRFVRTEEISAGYGPTTNSHIEYGITFGDWTNPGFQSISNTYNNALPDLNVSYAITQTLIARFAAARVMQRPDMNLLAAASSPSLVTQPPVSGLWLGNLAEGNPNLKPYVANQLDLSLEWYFNDRSLLSVALFGKKVQNFVLTNHFTETLPVTLTSVPPASGLTVGQVLTGTFNVSQPVNSQQTTIKGLEIGYQQPFISLPSVLKNVGAEANFTHLWAGDLPLQPGGPLYPLPGVSKNTYNAGLYYESPRFGVHALYNYRSTFLVDPLMYFGDGSWTKSYGQLDFSGSFKINDYVSIAASVLNATNSALVQFNKYDINRLYELSGTRYILGVRVAL